MLKRKLLTSLLAPVGMALAVAAGSAAAAPTTFFPITQFEDDNNDWLVKSPNNTDPNRIEIGDRLVAIFEFTHTVDVLGSGGAVPIGPGEELTGIADVTVISKVASGAPGQFDFVFAPTAADGTIVRLYLDSTPDLFLVGTGCAGGLAGCTANATDGALYLTAGFLGDAEEFWVATGRDDVAVVAALPASTKVAQLNFALSVMINNTGLNLGLQDAPCVVTGTCTGDGKIHIVGSGDILGGRGLINGAFGRSDTDAQIALVPAPASLALLGIGLVGLGAARRKQK